MNSYSVPMYCSNCGYTWLQYYEKGNEVPVVERCPQCECLTGHKEGIK